MEGEATGLASWVVGLGAGTLAAYGTCRGLFSGFYEIDPQVVELSLGQKTVVHLLQDSRATN